MSVDDGAAGKGPPDGPPVEGGVGRPGESVRVPGVSVVGIPDGGVSEVIFALRSGAASLTDRVEGAETFGGARSAGEAMARGWRHVESFRAASCLSARSFIGLKLFIRVERSSRGSMSTFQIGSQTITAPALIITEPATSVG